MYLNDHQPTNHHGVLTCIYIVHVHVHVCYTWWSIKKYSSNVLHSHLFHYVRREHSGGKCTPKNVRELLVQASNTHLLEVPVRTNECSVGGVSYSTSNQLNGRLLNNKG